MTGAGPGQVLSAIAYSGSLAGAVREAAGAGQHWSADVRSSAVGAASAAVTVLAEAAWLDAPRGAHALLSAAAPAGSAAPIVRALLLDMLRPLYGDAPARGGRARVPAQGLAILAHAASALLPVGPTGGHRGLTQAPADTPASRGPGPSELTAPRGGRRRKPVHRSGSCTATWVPRPSLAPTGTRLWSRRCRPCRLGHSHASWRRRRALTSGARPLRRRSPSSLRR